MTHKLLDKISQKIIYRSAVRPLTKSNPNHRLTEDGGEASTSKQPSSKIPTVFIRSRQDDADPSHIKPMPEFDPDDLIGRTFLLPPQENGERLRAKVTKKVIEEIEAADGNRILTEFRQPLQVQSHLEMPGILVQLGHIQRT